jgi:hypothetical protein
MSSISFAGPRLTAAAAAACLVLFAIGAPSASAAPSADDQGYLDSTARCTSPSTAVLFGSTETSRVAICRTADGRYQYRGVRLSDGAKLIVPAAESGNGFVAENGEISYLVTAKSLVVSVGHNVIRDEPMVDFHSPGASALPTTPTTPLPPPLPAEVGGDR